MAPSTPIRPTVPPDPYHTAATAIESSLHANADRRIKKRKGLSSHPHPPPALKSALADGKRQNVVGNEQPSLKGFITNHYAHLERKQEIRKEVLAVLAQYLNNYLSLFPGPEKAEHRKEAREFLQELGSQFSALVFARSGGTETTHLRPPSTPQTETSAVPQADASR
jgi:hypothetical protein